MDRTRAARAWHALAQWFDGDGVDINKTPKIAEHFERVGERAAVKKAIAEELAA